jgi:hypothetical protein
MLQRQESYNKEIDFGKLNNFELSESKARCKQLSKQVQLLKVNKDENLTDCLSDCVQELVQDEKVAKKTFKKYERRFNRK